MSLERLDAAIKVVASQHVYTRDAGDTWDITPRGDCEDFSLAVVKEYAGGGFLRFAWTILFGPFKFWFVDNARESAPHFQTEYTPTGEMFDNIWKRRVSKEVVARSGFLFVYRYKPLYILRKVIFT